MIASDIGLGIGQLFSKEGAKVVFSDINSKSGKAAVDDVVGKNNNALLSSIIITHYYYIVR